MKYPGFELIHGRKPIAGQDYDAHAPVSQDDAEYLTGTGDYSNDPEECLPTVSEAEAVALAHEARYALQAPALLSGREGLSPAQMAASFGEVSAR